MKIVIDIESLRHTRTGLAQYTFRLIDGLNRINGGEEIILLNNSFKKGRETRPELPLLDNPKIEYHNFKVSKKILKPLWNAIGFPRLEHLIGGFDVYHAPTHNELPCTHAKKVLTIHDLSFMKGDYHLPEFKEYLSSYFPSAAAAADVIIADSESTRRDVIEVLKVPEEKVKTVYLAASVISRRIYDVAAIKEVCQRHTIIKDYMLYIGTIEPRKNVANIIRAYNIFREGRKEAPALVLCGGKGWMYEEIFSTHESSPYRNDIIFTGYTPNEDLAFLLSGALFFLYPSHYEGFGLPVLEAMACGAPVITSNVSSLPEVAGDAAIQVAPDDVEAMADSMRRLTDSASLREEMRQKGFAQNAGFSWERCARETMAVYHSL
ncbi:MAG: glycosyltransferase family 1 protein [bacterium]